jgi:PAS domain S-box-containing protein
MRVLYVATDLREADALQQEVKKAAPKLAFEVCSGTAEARTRVEKTPAYDAMLLDNSLPENEQLQIVQHIRSKQLPLPVVALVAQGAAASSALVSAVDECVTRGPRLAERLAPGVRLAIERYRVVSTMTRENDRLKRSEARLRLIIEALPAGVVLVDQAGKILAMNLAGAALVGTAGPSDVVGREVYSLADDDGAQQLRGLVTRALTGERGKVDFHCLGPDGSARTLQLEALCIQRDATGVGSVLGVLSMPPAAGSEGVEFSFGDGAALADERAAMEQALESMRAEAAQLEAQANAERSRIQQVLTELERARATSAEHHAQRTVFEERYHDAETRVSELEARQHEAETALQNLVGRVEIVTEESASLRQEKERLAHEADALRQELVEQRSARAALEERVTGVDGERERLSSALAASQSSADERATQLAGELSGLQSAMAAAKGNEAELTRQLEQVRAEAAAHADAQRIESEARAGIEAELAALRGEVAGYAARELALQAEHAAVGQQAATLQAEHAALVTRVEAIAAERDDLHGHARGLEAARDSLHARAVELEAARDQLNGRVAELEAALAETRTRESAARSELEAMADVRARLAEAERGAAGQADRVRELEAAASDLESRRQAAVGRVAELEERRRNEQGALTAANERVNELTRELAAAREETGRIKAERAATESDLQRERESRQALEDEMTVKAAESGRLRSDLEQQLTGLKQELVAARADVEARERSLSDARRATQTVEAQLAAARESVAAELATVTAKIEDALQREAVLAAELQALQSERDSRGRQAFDLEATLVRERAARTDFEARLGVAERELADARVRAEQRTAEVERDHNEVVARLQKLLEQAAAREFQAAAVPRGATAERGGRRRPAERLGQLASAMANDLNGVVGEMSEEARRLLADLPEGSPLRARAEQSLQAATRAGTLVRHLLRMNERETRAVAGVEASAIVRANEPLLRQLAGQDIDLRFDLAAGLPPLECDAEEVVQVLSTLVVTVRGALPLGGTIRVVTQDRGRGEGRRKGDRGAVIVSVVAEGYGLVAVPTTVCEEVVTRCGGTFSSLVDPNQSSTTLAATLPTDLLNESSPGLSQTA